ncbi:uncharacterized protein LOC106771920 isoform X3 [Vigna radiata var. radiata]|uniref:Uncharacterized protein LOC106771920 isoform X3 n=1 Tax=Vigna radiata var. radiata TaxID=3916 RepID=A0A3Q0FEC8_VIGRR|nr:uncharacterized protein LOC106771920 isoform X3 [Vigna radiata var. radiata]
MKGGRSHRPQSSDPPDEWVDGSWTVDCICGVTFDDGEEMVKCDECGVWVHTRCSRYVKGDDTFACDKCKARHNNNPEETEVAQFLVELPTKTISMDNKKALPSRPRLWTDKPIQERVHVQGPPGGDPSIFSATSVSSIFSPHLWKACGYVPKKFNFQYKEFPFWSDNDDDMDNVNESLQAQTEAQPQAQDNNKNGAGALVYLSKDGDNNGAALVLDPSSVDARSGHAKETETGKFGSEDVPPRVRSEVKKERTLLRPPVVHNSKRSKGDFRSSNSKDRSGKKRVRTTSDREVDPMRRTLHSSKSVFTTTGDAKQVDFYEDRGPKILKADTRSIKNKNLKETVVQECVSDDYLAVDTIMEEPNNNIATTEDSSEPLYPDTTRHGVSVVDVPAEEKPNHKPPTVVEMSSKTDDAVTSALKQNNVGNASAKEKDGDCSVADNADDSLVARSAASPHTEGYCGSAPELADNQFSQDLERNKRTSSTKCKVKMKREDDIDNFKKPSIFHPSPISDLKNNEKLSDHKSDVEVNDAPVPSLPSCENKVGSVDISSEVIPADYINKPNELSGDICPRKQELEGYEGSLETQKVFSEIKDGSDSAKDPSRSEALGCPAKVLACVGKSSPTSSTMNSKSLGHHDIKSEDTETANPFTKHGAMTDSSVQIKNENCTSNVARDDNPKKSVRERPKSSLNSNSKGLHSSRSVHNSVSKQANSDVRDSVSVSSKSLIHQTASISGSSESNVSLHNQKVQVQNKISSSAPQKVEKVNQTNIATSSKLNQGHVPSTNPSPISNSSMLSDEELALLLHQELNSSPRVPRVPRARHAGSLPQLSSASATSMLMKRTSGGGKDHYLVSRRKHKDASRDGSGSSRDLEDEAKKVEKEKGPTSSDQRKQDMSYMEDAPAREEGPASMTAANSIAKNIVSSTSAIANSDPSSPPEDQNLSSMRNSPRNISDDDTATAGRPAHHTLPGLINEIIMSKGRRMTYEELCSAVLPHWHNLRKHNGERYAYSSHSQAVLDCLRNRQEWARLVDRGPKTNSNRKRRKLEAEESDDNGYGKGRTGKETEGKNFELQKEEFPKGKRKARKRRRLALQGRAVKDVRRRQKTDSLTDEDVGPFSNSSEESMFSEDEIQVGRVCPAGSTSDETGD